MAKSALTVTKNLILLEKGREELLLVNSIDARPLYIKRGRDYVKGFLESVRRLQYPKKINRAYPEDQGLLQMLLDHRILIPLEDQRKGLDHAEMDYDRKGREDKSSISLYLLLSQSCNLGCIYCLNGIKTYKKDKNLKMNEEVAFKSVERCLETLNPNGKLEIVFFGGEPLLNWALAKKVISHCEKNLKGKYKDKEICYHLTSNLTLLPDDLIEWAKRHRITFLCDIDGPPHIHNECRPYKNGRASHASILRNIRRLTQAGLEVALRSTVTAMNQDCLVEITKHHREIGGIGSAFVPVNPVNSDEDILPESMMPSPRKLLKGLAGVYQSKVWQTKDLFPFNVYASHLNGGGRAVMGCGAPYGNTPVVDTNGDVYPCIYLVGIRRFYLGNILDESYPNDRVLDWMADFLHVDHMEECKGCAWRYICGGGCPVGKLTVFENPLATEKTIQYCNSIRCDYTKKIIELLLWDLAKEAASSLQRQNSDRPAAAIDHTVHC